jgi:hypothetical protein
MSNQPKPEIDPEFARKLLEAAFDLEQHREKSQHGESPKILPRIEKGANYFFQFHSRGERALIGYSFIGVTKDLVFVRDKLAETIEEKAPFNFQAGEGCFLLIFNPTRAVLISLLIFIVTVAIAPHLPPETYEPFRRLFEGIVKSS